MQSDAEKVAEEFEQLVTHGKLTAAMQAEHDAATRARWEKTKNAVARVAGLAALDAGWDAWGFWRNNWKTGVTTKLMRNGWRLDDELKATVQAAVTKALAQAGIEGVVSWKVGDSWRGKYDWLKVWQAK